MKDKDDKIKEYTKKMKDHTKYKEGVSHAEVKKILCRIRFNNAGYTLIECKDGECIFYQDSQIVKILDMKNAEWKSVKQLNYNTVFNEIKENEEQLAKVMVQREEALRRVSTYMEESNSKFL